MRDMLRLMRVQEWVKNVFVAAPLLFSGHLASKADALRVLLVMAALCAIASGIYVFNDIQDRARDQAHPTKRRRPIAAGRVSVVVAGMLAAGLELLGAGLLILARVPASVWAMVGAYLLINVWYSLYLKRKVIADVLAIAIGYVLRVLIGGAIIAVAVTHWLVLCTFLLATFLGFSKRRHELEQLGAEARQHRPVLLFYSEQFLDQASLLTLAITMTCYVLYTISPETIARFGTSALVYSGLIVMFALFRYLFLIHVKKMGSPVEALYYDRQIVLAVVCWVLYVYLVVYTLPALKGRIG